MRKLPPIELRPAGGFTLIEVMVALVIVALGMMAVDTQLNSYAANSVYMEDKTLANWIATNRLTELRLQSTWPAIGVQQDDVDFAGRKWHYRLQVSKTEEPNLRRADIAISPADEPNKVIDREFTLIAPPAPPGFAAPHWTLGGGGSVR